MKTKFFARYDETGKLVCVGTGVVGVEITEAEYNRLLTNIREKAALVNQLYGGEITLSDVPEACREEIQRRVDERVAAESEVDEQELSAEEALDIILGGEA